MMLSDTTIRAALDDGRIVLDPLDPNDPVQPASVDVRLGEAFRVFNSHRHAVVDPFDLPDDLTEQVVASTDEPFVLHPGEFALAATLERVSLAADLVARVEGKSSLGRLGLLTHATAGFVDPSWDGHITLELSNVSNLPVLLRPGMRIAQLAFQQLDRPAARPYGHPDLGSKYQGQTGPTASKYDHNVRPVAS